MLQQDSQIQKAKINIVYNKASNATATPRRSDKEAFVTSNKKLSNIKKFDTVNTEYLEAIDLNNKLWTTIINLVQDDANELNDEIKAGLISLGLFVNKTTNSIKAESKKEERDNLVQSLIDVNMNMADGLK